MLADFLSQKIKNAFPYEPTEEQDDCIGKLTHFITIGIPHKVFLLNGFAGTGKTSIISALVNGLASVNIETVLMAPTGRAAKVMSNYSHKSAYSIHKIIYRQKSISESRFILNFNKHKNTIFIVDEASMITNAPTTGNLFGSGRLLDDLVEYVYSGNNCSMILLGDTAQLLPVGQNFSPALDARQLKSYGLEIFESQLSEVLRQSAESGILFNATLLRKTIEMPELKTPKFNTDFNDFIRISGEELIEKIYQSYNEVGMENCMILCYSNKRANLYNRGIRNQVLQKEEEINNGDLIMITRNNYYWSKPYEGLDFIANGEIAEIVRTNRRLDMYNCKFADVTLKLQNYNKEIEARILIDSLYTDTPQAQNELNNTLFETVSIDYEDITNKHEKYRQMRENDYLNALQVKFAYAITCHKAQGGQWEHVFIDQGFINTETMQKEYFQWLYTAFTRAQKKLFLINFNNIFF